MDKTQQGCSDWTLLGLSILRIEKTFYLAAFPNSFICNSRNFKSRSMRLILSSVASESTQQHLDRTKLRGKYLLGWADILYHKRCRYRELTGKPRPKQATKKSQVWTSDWWGLNQREWRSKDFVDHRRSGFMVCSSWHHDPLFGPKR